MGGGAGTGSGVTPVGADPIIGSSWWRIEILDWDMDDVLATIIQFTDLGGSEAGNDQGGFKFTVMNNHPVVPMLETDHLVARFSILNIAASTPGSPVWQYMGAGITDRPVTTTIDPGETSKERTVVSGRSIYAQLGYSQVEPAGGVGSSPHCPTRWWNMSHHTIDPSTTPWVDATERALQGDVTALPPNGLAALPWAFCNPLAYWLAPRVASGADPAGNYGLAFDYVLAEDTQVFIEATADDGFMLFCDEIPVGIVWDYPNGDAASDTWRGEALLKAGTKRIRVVVGNFPRPGSTTNAGLFVMAMTKPTIDARGYNEDFLLTTSTTGWRALDYANTSPWGGPFVGAVFEDLWVEAQGRDELLAWTKDFDDETDSNGAPWVRLPGVEGFTAQLGNDYIQVAQALREGGWWETRVVLDSSGFPVLQAFNPGTGGETVTDGLVMGSDTGDGNLTSLVFDIDHSGAYDTLLVTWPTGSARAGSGRRSGHLNVDAITETEALSKAAPVLAAAATSKAVSGGIEWSDQTKSPFFGLNIFDTVPAVDRAGDPVDARVVGLGWSANGETGRPQFVLQLEARRIEAARRQQLLLNRAANGAMGGRSASAIPATSTQRPMERIALWQFSWDVQPAVEASLESGLAPIDKPAVRMTRLVATATTGTGTTEFAIAEGVDLLGYISLGAGTPAYAIETFLATVLHNDDLIQLKIHDTIVGTHEKVVIVAYGAEMGLPAYDPRSK